MKPKMGTRVSCVIVGRRAPVEDPRLGRMSRLESAYRDAEVSSAESSVNVGAAQVTAYFTGAEFTSASGRVVDLDTNVLPYHSASSFLPVPFVSDEGGSLPIGDTDRGLRLLYCLLLNLAVPRSVGVSV